MNKSEFVSFIAEQHECSKAHAERTLNLIIDSVIDAVAKGERINLVGFGSFSVHHRAARNGRDPNNGKAIRIGDYNQVIFKAGQKLKNACN